MPQVSGWTLAFPLNFLSELVQSERSILSCSFMVAHINELCSDSYDISRRLLVFAPVIFILAFMSALWTFAFDYKVWEA